MRPYKAAFHHSSKLQIWLQSQLQTHLKPSDDRMCVTVTYKCDLFFCRMEDEDEIHVVVLLPRNIFVVLRRIEICVPQRRFIVDTIYDIFPRKIQFSMP